MPVDRDPVQIARALADQFERAHIPYAVGGALALAYWAPPRGTADADLNVFVAADQVDLVHAALQALEDEGVTLDRAAALHEIATGGAVRGLAGRTPVDVFFDSTMAGRRRGWSSGPWSGVPRRCSRPRTSSC